MPQLACIRHEENISGEAAAGERVFVDGWRGTAGEIYVDELGYLNYALDVAAKLYLN